jgi:3-hydroxybutyryl-CoA dehydrogenase
MSADAVETIAVIGAGTMGRGIAYASAVAGHRTWRVDTDDAARSTATAEIRRILAGGVRRGILRSGDADEALGRITTTTRAADAVTSATIVIEAIVEDVDIKRRMFAELDALAPAEALLATNTSSLSVAAIAAATRLPARVLGLHFFNPVHIMKLVEVVTHAGTPAPVLERALAACRALAKEPIVVRDSPGFASSRLGVALGLEAMRMLQEGVASAADIDKAMELGYGHPMGPLRVSDLVGLDVRLNIAEHLFKTLGGARFEPPEVLRDKVAAGELGKKTGKGFYEWPKQ